MLKWIERTLIGTALLGLFLECMAYFQIGNFVMIWSLLILALFYLFFSIFFFTSNVVEIDENLNHSKQKSFNEQFSISIGIALFLQVITILFKHFLWPGIDLIKYLVLLFSIVLLIITTYKYIKVKGVFFSRILKYLLIYSFINIFLFSLPRFFWFEIKYRNHPNFIEAYEANMTHYKDSILDKKAEIEYKKMVQKESK